MNAIRYEKDAKMFWENINSLLPKKSKNTYINLLDRRENKIIKCADTADFINQFFTNIGLQLAKKFTRKWQAPNHGVQTTMNDMFTDVEEVIKLCNEIQCFKSSTMDNLSSRLLKDNFLAVPEVLTHCFNLSFQQAKFPDRWKLAKIIPLFKWATIGPCHCYHYQVNYSRKLFIQDCTTTWN